MKILQIMGSSSDGGAEIFFIDALLAIKNKNVKQYAIINKDNEKGIKRLQELKIPLKTISFNKIFKWPSKVIISKIIKEFKPDIIHYWMGRASSFLIHGKHINVGWHSGYRGVERFRECDFHLALTRELKDHLVLQGIEREKIYVLPIYTNENKSKKITRKTFDTPEGVPLLLSLSRLHPVKGIDILLKAMVKVPRAYLWIAGSGPLEKNLIDEAIKLDLNDRVKFLGWRNDKEALMATSDICVFPSRNDAFGAVIIEAWAAKKPNIACKSPGPLSIISDNKDGILVEIDNVDQLANAINKVIKKEAIKNTIINNGYKKFIENYSEKVFAVNAIKIYKLMIKNKINKF